MQLHEEIRHLREQLGLTQGELAADYATASYISIIEKGKAVPSRKVLRRIAEKLGKPPYYFEAHVSQSDDTLELRSKVEQLRALAGAGKLDEAHDIAEELRAAIPSTTDDDVRGRYLMAMGYYSWASDDLDAAVSYYRQALDHFSSLEWHHRRIDALYGLGNISLRRGHIRQAADYLREAIAIDDNTKTGTPGTLYGVRTDYANCLVRMGKAEEAYRLLTELTSSSTDYPSRIYLLMNLSRASQEIGEHARAYEFSRQACMLAEKSGDLANRAAAQQIVSDILTDAGDYENAEKTLIEAELAYAFLGNRYRCNQITILKARLAVLMGHIEQADKLLASIDSDIDEVLSAEASLVQADKHHQLGEVRTAIGYIDSAAEAFLASERFGSAIQSWHRAAKLAHSAGDPAEAATLLFKAIDAYNQSRKEVTSDEVSP